MKKHVIIVAGGKGLRMGGDIPKQFVPVGGKPVLMRTLEAFHAYDSSMHLIVVLLVMMKNKKKPSLEGLILNWRRERDSNPRYG